MTASTRKQEKPAQTAATNPSPSIPSESAVTAESTVPAAAIPSEPAAESSTPLASDDASAQADINEPVVTTPEPDEGASVSEKNSTLDAAPVDGLNPVEVDIFPLRTYQDAGELKRRGGPSYRAPRLHAKQLIAAGLATDKKPKA